MKLKEQTIVLCDSSSTFQNLIKLMGNAVFITFDYESHILLSQKNIRHIVSDTYLKIDDISMLQENCYHFSKFFNKKEISDLMTYNGIQLGRLLYVELYVFLLPFLKKFFEIKMIYDINTSANFIASPNLIDLVKLFTDNVRQINRMSKKSDFLYDNVKINFKIKNSSFNIKVPNSYYVLLKNISDIFIGVFNHIRICDKSRKFSLLTELDTIKYARLLENNNDFLIYNRRRPTIWNFKSFDVIRRSNSYVAINSDLKIKDNKTNFIAQESDKIINSLFKNESFFSTFFSLNGVSFWNVLKPHFIRLCTKRFRDAISEIIIAEQLLKKFHIDSILVWSENGFNELIMIQLANKYGIPSILVQHGLYYDTIEAKNQNEFQGVLPMLSNSFAVWGKSTENYALKCGIPQNKIIVVGNAAFDELFENKHENLDNEFVLLATQSPTNASINDLTVDVMKKYESVIKNVCEIVTKLNKKLVIKLHPDPYEFDITTLVHKINKSIKVIKKGNVQDLIRKCEVFIAIDISTTILEAQILEKPTISIAVKDYLINEDNCSVFTSKSCIRTKIEDLEIILNKILSDESFKSRLIQNGRDYVNQYLYNQNMASKALSKITTNTH